MMRGRFDRNALVEEHVDIARYIAHQWCDRHSIKISDHTIRAEVLSDALYELVILAEKFDPKRGLTFRQFINLHLPKRIIDCVRQRTENRRLMRNQVKVISMNYKVNNLPIGESTNMIDYEDPGTSLDSHVDIVGDNDDCSGIETADWIQRAIQHPKDRLVLGWIADGVPKNVCAERLGVSPPAITQRINSIRRKIADIAEGPALRLSLE